MIDDMPPHTCVIGPEGPCRACEWLEWDEDPLLTYGPDNSVIGVYDLAEGELDWEE